MRHVFVACLCACAFACSAFASTFTDRVGTQYWIRSEGGRITGGERLDVGADTIAGLGGRAMRLLFSAGHLCPGGADGAGDELLRRAREPDAAAAFAHPAIHTYHLTALDCLRGGRYWFDPARYADAREVALVEAGVRDLALHLMTTYRGTGKRFIVSNWETDNAILCSNAYGYALNQETSVVDVDGVSRTVRYREWCDRIYAHVYRGIPNARAAFAGARIWFEARQRGVEAARRIAALRRVTGVTVLHAPEISITRALAANGQPSTLYDTLAPSTVKPDLVSYSAYETTNLRPEAGESAASNAIAQRIADDLALVRAVSGRAAFIGEFGYAVGALSSAEVVRLNALVHDAALDLGVPLVFNWQLFDDAFGLYAVDGSALSPLGAYYRCRFNDPAGGRGTCMPGRTGSTRPPTTRGGTSRGVQ